MRTVTSSAAPHGERSANEGSGDAAGSGDATADAAGSTGKAADEVGSGLALGSRSGGGLASGQGVRAGDGAADGSIEGSAKAAAAVSELRPAKSEPRGEGDVPGLAPITATRKLQAPSRNNPTKTITKIRDAVVPLPGRVSGGIGAVEVVVGARGVAFCTPEVSEGVPRLMST
jgi:hypothetical protein